MKFVSIFIFKRTDKYHDTVNQSADAKQTACTQIDNTGTNFADIEAMETKHAEKQAEQKSNPLIFFGVHATDDTIVIDIGIRILNIDYDWLTILIKLL